MPTMTYKGKTRTVQRGPRTYELKQGTFEADADDVTALEELGATLKDDDGSSSTQEG